MLGTWFGAGLLPVMPGTWGSLAALPCAWAIRSLWGVTGLAIGTAIVFAVGCWAAGTIAKTTGIQDPGAIVIDEVAAQWLVLLPAPLHPLPYAAAFALFRIFDIWKPGLSGGPIAVSMAGSASCSTICWPRFTLFWCLWSR